MTDYFFLPELPGKKYFNCTKLTANINIDACASMWKQANHENLEQRARCKCCPIGALHAGQHYASLSPLKGTLTCARCQRPAVRLIGGMHCVSCKNREYEYCKGRNAKGSRPIKMAPLAPRSLHYMHGREPCSIRRNLTRDTSELVVAVLRDSRDRVAFGFKAAISGERQRRLFP